MSGSKVSVYDKRARKVISSKDFEYTIPTAKWVVDGQITPWVKGVQKRAHLLDHQVQVVFESLT